MKLRLLGVIGPVVATALVIACGTETDSTFVDGAPDSGQGLDNDGSFGSRDTGPGQEDLYANDPPPPWCGPGGDPAPPAPGGTEACPDDKNKPGCSCPTIGAKAKCWTGLRKHRNLGVCADGETTCLKANELQGEWGECVGEKLPTPGATKGAPACTCFSAGQWKIANLSPCSSRTCSANPCTGGNITSVTAVSTHVVGGVAQCPTQNPPTSAPAEDWSTSTLKVDCAGHFKLCLRIRAGNFDAPNPATDCIVGEVCTEGDYKEANVEQAWPNLPGWIGADKACAKTWDSTPSNQSAGYAEMIVKGESVRCDPIDDGSGNDLVFNRLKYCPMDCNTNPSAPECASCRQSGEGEF